MARVSNEFTASELQVLDMAIYFLASELRLGAAQERLNLARDVFQIAREVETITHQEIIGRWLRAASHKRHRNLAPSWARGTARTAPAQRNGAREPFYTL